MNDPWDAVQLLPPVVRESWSALHLTHTWDHILWCRALLAFPLLCGGHLGLTPSSIMIGQIDGATIGVLPLPMSPIPKTGTVK